MRGATDNKVYQNKAPHRPRPTAGLQQIQSERPAKIALADPPVAAMAAAEAAESTEVAELMAMMSIGGSPSKRPNRRVVQRFKQNSSIGPG